MEKFAKKQALFDELVLQEFKTFIFPQFEITNFSLANPTWFLKTPAGQGLPFSTTNYLMREVENSDKATLEGSVPFLNEVTFFQFEDSKTMQEAIKKETERFETEKTGAAIILRRLKNGKTIIELVNHVNNLTEKNDDGSLNEKETSIFQTIFNRRILFNKFGSEQDDDHEEFITFLRNEAERLDGSDWEERMQTTNERPDSDGNLFAVETAIEFETMIRITDFLAKRALLIANGKTSPGQGVTQVLKETSCQGNLLEAVAPFPITTKKKIKFN